MVVELRRGFKAEAERIALSVRSELNLTAIDRLDPLQLAEDLHIPVVTVNELSQHGASERSIARLLTSDAGFCAGTVCAGTRHLIVYNPQHAPGRRANSLAHELSHVILEHPARPALGEGGCRYWNGQLEAEADYMASTLLVPRAGLLAWLKQGGDPIDGPYHFGVSQALFQWRLNQTGVQRQLPARAHKLAPV